MAKKAAKEKAAKKIMKKMGDKGKYSATNQVKTLIVMNVLGVQKNFFDVTRQLPDTQGFFTDSRMPDGEISDNNRAAYFLMGRSDAAHNALVQMQYK